MRRLLKPLAFLPAVFLMYIIFSFSGDTGAKSSEISYKVSSEIVKAVNQIGGLDLSSGEVKGYADKIHGKVRKLAHMTEYAVLAVAVSFPLYVYGVRGIFLMILAGGFCVLFAWGDEYHQAFVSGRVSSRKDVLIDSIGAMIGILFVRIVGWTGRMTIFRPRPGKMTRKQRRREIRAKRRQTKRERRSRIWKSRFSTLRGLFGKASSKQKRRSGLQDGNSNSRPDNRRTQARPVDQQFQNPQGNRKLQKSSYNEKLQSSDSDPVPFQEQSADDPFGNLEQKLYDNMKKELQMKEILDKKS